MRQTKQTIREQLKELRNLIDSSPHDIVLQRIAYEIETAVRYVIEDTEGWESLAQQAKDAAVLLRRELSY